MIICDDCINYMNSMKENSVDSIVTDPPYELKFMGNKWDSTGISFDVDTWTKCLRILKPGGFLLAFGCPKNVHRMICAIEDAGFKIVDEIFWLYGTGMAKGQNIGKIIEEYQDFHTQLKPACEIICVAQKLIIEKTIAKNVAKYGTGAFNIGACRIKHNEPLKTTNRSKRSDNEVFNDSNCGFDNSKNNIASANPSGRFPSNVILDEDVANLVDKVYGNHKSGSNCYRTKEGTFFEHRGLGKVGDKQTTYGDSGGISRFFYCAKASKKEKNIGCEDLPKGNNHTTVKPIKLMEYLVKLVTPPNGTVLDPFMGSGTTGIACKNNNFEFIGIEKEQEYFDIAERRIYA